MCLKRTLTVFLGIILFSIGVPSLYASSTFPPSNTNQELLLDTTDTQWYLQPQVYNMVAFGPKEIDKYHITVNGLWNGFIGENVSSPFALGILRESILSGRTYETDEEFVEAQHAQGMIVPGTILTVQGHRSLQKEDFDRFASRGINGELCNWDIDADSYWMNALNPEFIAWCIQHGKKAIDAGADMIVLDEIQGNGLIPMVQFSSQYTGIPAPGFSRETIEGFRSFLDASFTPEELETIYGIFSLAEYDLANRIAGTVNLAYEARINVDPLIVQYDLFLEQSNFEAKKELILALRAYAEEQNKDLVISANSYALGSNNPFEFWTKGLLFADLLDLFTFENTFTAVFDQTVPEFPRTKWLAWERLANAATGAPAAVLIDTNTVEAINKNIFPLFGFSRSLSILCAEAYANKGSFVNYHFPLVFKAKNWRGTEKIHGFVMENKELFDYSSAPYDPLGIVFFYSEGMRKHYATYLGCAQALAERHIPFEVVFDGDGTYIEDDIAIDDLVSYPFVLVPSMIDVTAKQKAVIIEYVNQGGIAGVFDVEAMGYSGQSGEVPYGKGFFYFFEEDVGARFYQTYDPLDRQELGEVVKRYVEETMEVSRNDGKVVVTPYVQEDAQRLVLHVINYDHIGFFDFIWPQSSITIRIRKPAFQVSTVKVKTMDGETRQLSFEVDEGYIEFTLPTLRDYAVIILEFPGVAS